MTTLYRAILAAGFMATASLADIDADIDPQRMQRDIRIMEGVLVNLYHDAPDQANFHARGLHLDGYGMLFLAAEPRLMEEIRDNSLSRRKWTALNRDLLAEFLGNYAGTIGQLNKDDRITVCYLPKPRDNMLSLHDPVHFMSFDLTNQTEPIAELRDEERFDTKILKVTYPDSVWSYITIFEARDPTPTDEHIATIGEAREFLEKWVAEGKIDTSRAMLVRKIGEADSPVKVHILGLTSQPAALAATVKKSAIDAFREGRIDSATFRQRIAFSEYEDSKKIDIMAGIFDQVVGHDQLPLIHTQRTLGMYQPGVGALFFIRTPVSLFPRLPSTNVESNILEAVADYGATLIQVQADEHIIVEYRHSDLRLVYLQVPKPAIDAYASSDLDHDAREAFRKKAVWKWVK